MKKYKFIMLLAVIFSFNPLTLAQADVPLDRMIAIVNDQAITASELNDYLNLYREQVASLGQVHNRNKLEQIALSQLIDQTVQKQLAVQKGLEVSDSELNDAITDIAKARKMTMPQLMSSLAQQGVPREFFREQIRAEMLVNELQKREIASKIIVSDQEISLFITNLKTIDKVKAKQELDLFGDNSGNITDDPKTRAELRTLIYQRKFSQNLAHWVAEVRDSAYVQIFNV